MKATVASNKKELEELQVYFKSISLESHILCWKITSKTRHNLIELKVFRGYQLLS